MRSGQHAIGYHSLFLVFFQIMNEPSNRNNCRVESNLSTIDVIDAHTSIAIDDAGVLP
jgi:hypothetical protein